MLLEKSHGIYTGSVCVRQTTLSLVYIKINISRMGQQTAFSSSVFVSSNLKYQRGDCNYQRNRTTSMSMRQKNYLTKILGEKCKISAFKWINYFNTDAQFFGSDKHLLTAQSECWYREKSVEYENTWLLIVQ